MGNKSKSPYELYVSYCERLGQSPMSYEAWDKFSSGVREPNEVAKWIKALNGDYQARPAKVALGDGAYRTLPVKVE